MNIGYATIGIDRDGDFYKVQVNAQSVGMVDSLYRLRNRGESIMGTDPISPVETKIAAGGQVQRKGYSHKVPGRTVKIKAVEKKSENGTRSNTMCAMSHRKGSRWIHFPRHISYAGSIEGRGGEGLDVYPGKYQYN